MEPPHPSEELQQARNLLNIAWNNGTEKDVRIEEQEAKIQQLERELKQLKETSHSRSPASLLRGRERLREELEAEGANKDPQSRQGSSPGFLMISAVEGEKNQDTSHSTHRERSYFICTDPIRNERDHMDLELGADPQASKPLPRIWDEDDALFKCAYCTWELNRCNFICGHWYQNHEDRHSEKKLAHSDDGKEEPAVNSSEEEDLEAVESLKEFLVPDDDPYFDRLQAMEEEMEKEMNGEDHSGDCDCDELDLGMDSQDDEAEKEGDDEMIDEEDGDEEEDKLIGVGETEIRPRSQSLGSDSENIMTSRVDLRSQPQFQIHPQTQQQIPENLSDP